MGIGSAKRVSARAEHTPVRPRRSVSRSYKEESCTPTPRSSRNSHSKSIQSGGSFTSRLPTDQERRSNGRVTGRSLIVWGRPRMAEKLLLHIQYECARHRSQIPWDAIAHRLHPGSSGAAIIQHLGRLRREIVTEGHLVPPMACRPGAKDTQDPEIRGFIREEGHDQGTVRPVRFDEHIEDRRVNLPSSFDEDEDHSDGDGPASYHSDVEGDADLPESPTPMGRRYRMASARRPTQMPARLEAEAGSTYPVPPGASLTKEESMPIDEALMEHEAHAFASPETPSSRDSGLDEHGAPAGHEFFEGPMMPQLAFQRPPLASERNYPSHPGHAFGESFEGHGQYAAAMQQMPRMPFEYFHHAMPYGFPPWPMGYPMNPSLCFPGYPHERMTERPVNDVSGGSDSDVQPKVEPSQTESQSSNGTQATEPQLEDLVSKQTVGAADSAATVDPANISQA